MSRICELPECGLEFEPVVEQQRCCTKAHANRLRVRRFRAKGRNGNGGPNGNGGGGMHEAGGASLAIGINSDGLPVIGHYM